MDASKVKAGKPEEEEMLGAAEEEKELTAHVDEKKAAQPTARDIEIAREVADSQIEEPAIEDPVPTQKKYTTTVLVILALCAAFLIIGLFLN